jgi:ribosome-associated heat shock protein Hsp15
MIDRPAAPAQRLDKWLWFARVTKSRTLAAQLIDGGKVRVNRVRALKPSHALRQGDVLTIALHGEVRVLQVLATGTRRGPPQEARLLYRLVTESKPAAAPAAGPASDDDIGGGRLPNTGQRPLRRARRL